MVWVRHLSESFSPPTPWMSIRSKAPVIASKPVGVTMMSNS